MEERKTIMVTGRERSRRIIGWRVQRRASAAVHTTIKRPRA
jgi:hypothetical protein